MDYQKKKKYKKTTPPTKAGWKKGEKKIQIISENKDGARRSSSGDLKRCAQVKNIDNIIHY